MSDPRYDGSVTADDLDGLPVGSVILDLGPHSRDLDRPVIACKAVRGDWAVMGDHSDRRWWSHEIAEAAAGNVLIVAYNPIQEARSE